MLRWQLPLADQHMRSDQDPPIPLPPGEDKSSPINEPPDTPVLDPDSPVGEPDPVEPTRL